MKDKKITRLRSANWFDNPAQPDQTAIYLERFLNFGLSREELQGGRPIIGIAQSGSDLTPCNRHHLQLAERIKAGIRDGGGIPLEFPVHPIQETGRRPTAALDRNLAFLGLVEVLHGYPLDGVVLTTGCDKTTPAALMAAAAVDLPAIVLSGGPMLNGWDGEDRVGSGAIIWRSRERLAAGEIDYEHFMADACRSAPSIGHCNTMGTALTMNTVAEALGMTLPGCAAIPAPYRERAQMAYHTGRRITEMVWEDLKPSDVMSRPAFLNAIKVTVAIGGSTNAPVHLQAIANQLEVELSIHDWQEHGENVPLLANCQPAGEYLGEDFYRAGGVVAIIGELLAAGLIDPAPLSVCGETIGTAYDGQRSSNHKVIRTCSDPLVARAGFAVMTGNLFDSAVFKAAVVDAQFRKRYLERPDHPNVIRGRVVVFEGPEDYHARINDPALAIDEDCILVMRNCGPLGYPGSAEVVNMLPPDHLVRRGITQLPCLGDGRQSGTSASPSVLNVSPEAAAGGRIAILEDGDELEIDLNTNRVTLLLDEEAIQGRLAQVERRFPASHTPWQEIYRERVSQLDTGADLRTEGDYRKIHARFGIARNSH